MSENKKQSLNVKIKAWALRKLCHKKSPQPINHEAVSSILLMRYDRIGDMIVTTPLIHVLRRIYPKARIMVLASQTNYDVIVENPDVDEVLVFPKSLWARLTVLMGLRKRKLSMVVDLYHDLIWHAIIAIRLIKPVWVSSSFKNSRYGVNAKLLNLYDVMSQVNVTNPISEIYLGIASALGATLDSEDCRYRLTPNKEQLAWAKGQLGDGYNVGINLFGSRPSMRLKAEDCIEICHQILTQKPMANILLLTTQQTFEEMKKIQQLVNNKQVGLMTPKANIMFITALIKDLDLLITPDTSLVHVACAYDVPLIAVYVNSPALHIHWQPKHPSGRFKVIFSSEEKSLHGYSEQLLKQAVQDMLV